MPSLDGLRALAVLMVLTTHFWTDPTGYTSVNRLASFCWAGVDLFFVLSGFLITRLLWQAREQPDYFRNFYARRTLRIAPLYYAVLVVVFLALPLVGSLPEQVVSDRWMYFAYLSNVAIAVGGWQLLLVDITWSLAIEEQFYLAWPAVVRWMSRRRLIVTCLALVVCTPIARFLLWDALGWRWLHMMTPFRLDAFAVGALAGLLVVPKPAAVGTLVATGGTLLALVLSGHFGRDSWHVATYGYSLTAIASGAALLVAKETKWLTVAPLRHIGTVSYGMYLLHPLCVAVLTTAMAKILGVDLVRLMGDGLVGGLAAVLIQTVWVWLVASLSFYAFERRFLKLKRHFVPEPGRPERSHEQRGRAVAA